MCFIALLLLFVGKKKIQTGHAGINLWSRARRRNLHKSQSVSKTSRSFFLCGLLPFLLTQTMVFPFFLLTLTSAVSDLGLEISVRVVISNGCMDAYVAQSCLTLWDPRTVGHRSPLSVGFSRQEYWGGCLFPFQGNLLDSGIKPRSPALQLACCIAGRFFPVWATMEAPISHGSKVK